MGQRSQDRKEPRYFKVTVVEYLFTTFYYQLWFMVGLCLFVTIIFHFQVDPICGLATSVQIRAVHSEFDHRFLLSAPIYKY